MGENKVVFDLGSYEIKAGYAGEDSPRVVFPSLVARRKEESPHKRNKFVGSTIFQRTDELLYSKPIQHGSYKDIDGLTMIIDCCFDYLSVKSSECDVLLCESMTLEHTQKEKIADLLFDRFCVRSVTFQKTPLLGLLATGRTTGLVVESGHTITACTSVLEGKLIDGGTNGKQTMLCGGSDITKALLKNLNLENSVANYQICTKLKHQYCSFLNYDEEKYEMPDGSTITIREERKYGHVLFGDNEWKQSISTMITNSIENIEGMTSRKDVASSIILCGGSTLLDGFTERIHSDLQSWFIKPTIIDGVDQKNLTFMGGSMLLDLCNFKSFTTREQWKSTGPKHVHTTSLTCLPN